MKPGDNRGEKNIKSKLSEADVKEIFLCTDKTQQQLAEIYHVQQSTINHIKKGRTWEWLTSKLKKEQDGNT